MREDDRGEVCEVWDGGNGGVENDDYDFQEVWTDPRRIVRMMKVNGKVLGP